MVGSCRKEQFHNKGIPEVETTDAIVLDGIGAHFKGTILATGDSEILQHGFYWSNSMSISFPMTYTALLGPTDKAGVFECIAQSDILAGEKYYLRAFIQTNTHVIYGEAIQFSGSGCLPPEISSITPDEGSAGDTVVVRGKHFSSDSENNRVLFESQLLEPIWSDEGEMRFIVPSSSYGKKKIGVQVWGITSAGFVDYEVFREVLTFFEPVMATFGDTITLYGEGLCILKDHIAVTFNDIVAEITEVNSAWYKVIVPSASTRSPAEISIKSWETSSYNERFVLRQVCIESASPVILHSADTLTFHGSGFNPNPSLNRITVGGEEALALTSNSSSLRVLLPWSLEPGIYDIIITTIDNQPVTYSGLIELRSQWKRLSDFPGLPRSDVATFVLGNKAYAGTGASGGELLEDMWEFDAESNVWTQKNNFPRATTEVVGLALSGTGYMADFEIYGYPRCPVYAYNPVSDGWEKKSSLPINYYDGKGAGFTLGETLYLLDNTFTYRYNPSSDHWSLIAYINNYLFQRGVAFSDGHYGYFGIGMEKGTANATMWYRFNQEMNKWEARTPFPGEPRNSAVAFFLPNGQGYVGLGLSSTGQYLKDFWEYDPTNDSWKRLSDFPGEGRASAGAFTLFEQGYILAGNNGTDLKDFWIFNPAALDF